MTEWETHKPGVWRLYYEDVRAQVINLATWTPSQKGFEWQVDVFTRQGRCKQPTACGQCKTKKQAKRLAQMVARSIALETVPRCRGERKETR